MKAAGSITERIGKTPLLELMNYETNGSSCLLLPDTGERYLSTAMFAEE
ncbi:MAG: hypothetical protein Q3977_01275 [Oscillospiraceae bacterium]|nr:hypothetical protein [Oscillospiraceae bacterium]